MKRAMQAGARRALFALTATAAALGGPGLSEAADGAPSPPGAQACLGCHGRASTAPAIAGRPASEIESAMTQFRDGSRPATIMNRISKGFAPEETHAIAEWLAGGDGARP